MVMWKPPIIFTTNEKTSELSSQMTKFVKPAIPVVIFTDQDGSLLGHDDYKFDDVLPALRLIKKYDIPLIPVSSKTSAEIDVLERQLQIQHPIISENGASIIIPPNILNNLPLQFLLFN